MSFRLRLVATHCVRGVGVILTEWCRTSWVTGRNSGRGPLAKFTKVHSDLPHPWRLMESLCM